MRTVGQLLKEAREEKFYTLEEVEKGTKIRKELLVALEADNFSKLPPSTFVQGFIKNYAKFLRLDPKSVLAVYRRESSDKKLKPYVMDAFSNPLDKPRIQITPPQILGTVVVVIILSFFVYLWLQYRQFVGAPTLILTSPIDQQTTDNSTVTVTGKTDPEVKVLVNNQEIPVSVDGSFKEDINLSSQVNKLQIVAASKFGQKSQVERIVYVKGKAG